ncbi:hypothetical protein [Mucilaginibacter sp. 3215]|uniref:hypothetical protein n=1 Tax=Mucilaginibacter sp. 3215 TaxID=3373912 RepID=UPI003D1B4452
MTIVTILTPAALQLYIVRNDVMKTLESDKIPVVFRIHLQKNDGYTAAIIDGRLVKYRDIYNIDNQVDSQLCNIEPNHKKR